MFKQVKSSQSAMKLCTMFLALGLISCLMLGEYVAGAKSNKGGDDIILYNGNIVLRGGGKGKGKGGGSIVVANSGSSQNEFMPMFDWGGNFRRRR